MKIQLPHMEPDISLILLDTISAENMSIIHVGLPVTHMIIVSNHVNFYATNL